MFCIMDKSFKSFGRERKNLSPKGPVVIDLCDDTDDETVQTFSSSSTSVKSVKRARNELGRHFAENDQTFARKATSNFSQISFASHHHRNDLIGGSGTGFGGVLLQPKHDPAEQHGVAKNTSSRASSGKSRNYKRKKNGGKRKWNGEKKKRRSNTGSESRQSVWSNREMHVGPYHDHTRRNSGSGQYMRISTLNPEIRHVGGAEITYN